MKLVTEGGAEHELFTTPVVFEMTSVVAVTLEFPEGGFIVKEAGAEVCPPLDTVIDTVQAEAIRFVGIDAVNWVELPKVVGRGVPFH